MTIDEFNSQDYPRLHLTSETLTWDPTTNLYEQQENAMMDYSGNIVHDAAVRGQVSTLIVNELQLLTTDLADMTHDCNFHQVLTSHVVVSCIQRQRKPEWARAILQSSTDRLYDPCRPVDDCPGVCKEDCTIDYAAWRPHLLELHTCTTIPG